MDKEISRSNNKSLYFINVTDDEGKRCVKKVVRQ